MTLDRTDDPQLNLYLNYMFQVGRVPKRSNFEYCCVRVDEQGRGKVTIMTPAGTPTIQKWFKSAGLNAIRFDARGFHSSGLSTWRVTFQVVPMGGQG